MAKGDRINDADTLIRRCDPADTSHFKVNEQTGQRIMSRGAFRWDEQRTQLSVYQESILAARGIPRSELLDDSSWELWSINVGRVHAFTKSDGSAAFEAQEDPWPPVPEGKKAPRRDEAHAVVVKPKNLADRIERALAAAFQPTPLLRPTG